MACDISRLPPLSIKYVQSYNVAIKFAVKFSYASPRYKKKGPEPEEAVW